MRPMRGGVVTTTEHAGGAEQYLLRLYKGLHHRGLDGVLLGTLGGWASTGLKQRDIGLGRKWSRRSAAANMWELRSIRSKTIPLCRQACNEFDLLYFHAQFKREQVLLTTELSRLAPVVWTEHGRFYSGAGAKPLNAAYRTASKAVSCIICVSEAVAEDARAVCGNRVRLEVVPNAVDTRRFKRLGTAERIEARLHLGLALDRPLVVAHVRLQRDKRVERAIEVVIGTDAQLVIAGDGPERGRLEAMAARLDVDVRFTGHLDSMELLLGCADAAIVCAFPQEGHNIASLEAAAAGCCLFGFINDPTARFIEEAGGVLLEVGESIAGYIDQDFFRRSGDQARKVSLGFNEESWLSNHMKVIESILR
jgi:glycosyltransferase involved in cell wall biosynthesis